MATDNNLSTEDQIETNNVLNLDHIDKFEEHGHMMIVGTTNVGKTTFFLSLLAKGLFEFDEFAYLAPDNKQLTNVAHHVNHYFQNIAHLPNAKMYYFSLDNMRQFKKYLETSKSKHKFVFMDDSFVTGRSSQKLERMDLLMCLKNLKSTAAYTVHDAFHDNKGARLASRYIVACNLNENDFNRLFGLKIDNKLWQIYKKEEDYHNRIIIYDNVKQKYYDKTLTEIKH